MDDATLPDQAQIHPLTLRFRDRGLEAGFRAARAGANLRQLRVSLLIAVPLNIVFAPIDYLVLTQNVVTALIIRVPIATAVFLIVLGLSYSPLFRGRETYLPSIAVFCYTLAYAALNAIAASPTSWRRRSVERDVTRSLAQRRQTPRLNRRTSPSAPRGFAQYDQQGVACPPQAEALR